MKIILDDTSIKKQLYPFAEIKSAAEIRIGILTIRERWEKLLNQPIATTSEVENSFDSTILPANVISSKENIQILLQNGTAAFLQSDVLTINHPIDIFKNNARVLKSDFELIVANRVSEPISSTNACINPSQIFIEAGAKVEYAILNASQGPIYIGKNAEIMEGCMVRGPFALCEGAVLKMGSKIYGATTIGPHCVAAGEIKNSIMFGYSNKAHDGYLGDSVIGEWCNLGAGTTNSNVKNTAGVVKVWNNIEKKLVDNSNKCGLLMGDYSRTGINTSFNTGTTVGICCNIFGNAYPPKYVANFSWGDEQYQLEKALLDIDNWKKLKGETISENEKNILTSLFNNK